MDKTIRVALAQTNCVVGDLQGNADKVIEYSRKAAELEADIVAFPELTLTGYPPEDLLLHPQFVLNNIRVLQRLAPHIQNVVAVVGYVEKGGQGIYNAAAIINDGWIVDSYFKVLLPNYSVFDEKRYFLPGHARKVFMLNDIPFAVNICEDIWKPEICAFQTSRGGAQLVINISSSPYYAGKGKERELLIKKRISENQVPIAYCNLVGGQDELVFDGESFIFSATGSLLAKGKQFEEDLVIADVPLPKHEPKESTQPKNDKDKPIKQFFVPLNAGSATAKTKSITPRISERLEPTHEVYAALVTGLRDYVQKNKFQGVIIGLSGGIDSALTATVAVDALGAAHVLGLTMPSPFSSIGSITDSEQLCRNLHIRLLSIPIENAMKTFDELLAPGFEGRAPDITEENIQARIRGLLLMAFSNKFGYLVLSTGNKSELSVGYCTLYGDMVGGFAILKDVLKTLVYDLSAYRNQQAGYDLIPTPILQKEPSAELKPDQRDQDSLPPYEILDPILDAYIVENLSIEDIIAKGFEPQTVTQVIHMVDRAEYKRRQGAPGIKITRLAFGKDRRMPITNAYKESALSSS